MFSLHTVARTQIEMCSKLNFIITDLFRLPSHCGLNGKQSVQSDGRILRLKTRGIAEEQLHDIQPQSVCVLCLLITKYDFRLI